MLCVGKQYHLKLPTLRCGHVCFILSGCHLLTRVPADPEQAGVGGGGAQESRGFSLENLKSHLCQWPFHPYLAPWHGMRADSDV